MIPILNSQGQCDFHLTLGRNILRCCFEILKTFKATVSRAEVHSMDSIKYPELSDFISKIFQRHYGAKIKVSAPKIMTLIDQNDQPISALGIRPASGGKIFLEQYFDHNIEDILSAELGKKIKRDEIVEIGSLASRKKHAAKFLYIALAAYLEARGYRYAVVTGTDYLFKYFQKARMNPIVLGKAEQSRLVDKNTDWGNYYESKPQILLLDVKQANRALSGFLGIIATPCLSKFYPPISYASCC